MSQTNHQRRGQPFERTAGSCSCAPTCQHMSARTLTDKWPSKFSHVAIVFRSLFEDFTYHNQEEIDREDYGSFIPAYEIDVAEK